MRSWFDCDRDWLEALEPEEVEWLLGGLERGVDPLPEGEDE